MRGEPKIVYNGIAIYVHEAVKPDELSAVSGSWRDMITVKQELKVSRALWEGLIRHQRDVATQSRKRGALRVIVAPQSEWAMRVMVIETDPQYAPHLADNAAIRATVGRARARRALRIRCPRLVARDACMSIPWPPQ